MNKKTFIAGLFITGISLVITSISAFLWPDLLKQPAGLFGLFVTVFLALAGLLGGTIREWADNMFGKKKEQPETKRQINVGDNTTNVITDKFVQNIFQSTGDQEILARALFTIPMSVQDFAGREQELEQLKTNFLRGALITGISGGGGIGKTELARKLANEIKDNYPDARMEINLQGTSDTPLNTDEAMRRLLEPFYAAQKLPDDSNQLMGLYRQTFASNKALILLDNAANAPQVRPLLPPAPSAAIVTSRQHFSLTEFGLKEPLRLDVLSLENARELLRVACDKLIESTDQAIDKLAKLCGRLPLALRVAASLLNDRPDWSLDTLLQRLSDERTRLKRLKRPGDTDFDVEAIISLSYSLLSPEMQRLFRMLGVFPIQFWHVSAAEIWKINDTQEVDDHLGFLINHGLLNTAFTPIGLGANPGTAYSMHDLTRLFAMAYLLESVEESKEASERLANQYLIVGNIALGEFTKGGKNLSLGLNLFRAILPQLLMVWKRLLPEEKVWPRPNNADLWLSTFAAYYSELLSICLPSLQLITILESSLDATRRVSGNQIELEQSHLGNLGNVYLRSGYVARAIDFYEQLLAIQQELGDRAGKGKTLGNLGSAYIQLGESSKAIDFYEQALTIASEVGDRKNEGGWHLNLGQLYQGLGDHQKALTHTQHGLSIHREIGHRIGEATALNFLGHVYSAMGDIQASIKYYLDGLLIDREIGNRRGEGAALVSLATTYLDLGELAKAKTYAEQNLVIDREFNDQIRLGKALALLGLISFREGDRKKAIAYTEEAAKTLEAINHPDAEYSRAQLVSMQIAIKFEEFARKVIRARHTKAPIMEDYFAMSSKMARDPNMIEFQELGKVLQKILAGVKNPDLSKLPVELARLVKEELEK